MNRNILPYLLILGALLPAWMGVYSQGMPADAAGERIQVTTDRSMYISGEKVHFTLLLFHEKGGPVEEFSRIVYGEVITSDGVRITGMKYPLEKGSAQGCFTLPEDLISGNYYLRFYTQFMRNCGSDCYAYLLLKIINPNRTEVLMGGDEPVAAVLGKSGNTARPPDGWCHIHTGKSSYSPREEIRVELKFDSSKAVPEKVSVSVVPESTFGFLDQPVVARQKTVPDDQYLPETRGISLSGKIVDKSTRNAVPRVKVNLSIIGDKDIYVVRTDSSGRFFFALPDYQGQRDIFMCVDDGSGITPEILINNDFCTKPVKLPAPVFMLGDEEMKSAYQLMANDRVSAFFNPASPDTAASFIRPKTAFYGTPSEILYMAKYIELPTLQEYFTELPLSVKIRKTGDKKQFRFMNAGPEMTIFDPLVLIDWVAVNDMNKILAMSPLEIDRVELLDALYVKGNITYGGIISFVSRKSDFAGIELPKSGTFLNYRFLEPCKSDPMPADSLYHLPDSRNTLYWNPDLKPDPDGNARFTFKAPDTPCNYYILVKGFHSDGATSFSKEMITIRDDH